MARHRELTRDERLHCRILRDECHTYPYIASRLNCTLRQAQYTGNAMQTTPQKKKKTGRLQKLTPERLDEVILWIQQSLERRCLNYHNICGILDLGVCGETLRLSLKARGMTSHPAAQKPPILTSHRSKRLNWARARQNWSADDWRRVIFSDEAFFRSGWHRMPYILRFGDERYHKTAVIGQSTQRKGIMAWACFAGDKKGPLVIWDHNWGTLKSSTFIEHIVPKIDQFNIDLWDNYQIDALLMQDGAPCHWSYETTEELEGLDIVKTDHPPISPDLNPQENVWNWLEEYVSERCHSGIRNHELACIVQEGWHALPANILENLVCSMPRRVQEVIERDGRATQY